MNFRDLSIRRLGSVWLESSPFTLAVCRWVLGSLLPDASIHVSMNQASSHVLSRLLGRLSPSSPVLKSCPWSTQSQVCGLLAGALLPFSILGFRNPSFHLLRDVPAAFPCLREDPPPGLATRSMSVLVSETLGSLFQLPTLLGFPSRSVAPPSRSKKSFLFPSPFLHFPSKPLRPGSGASTVFLPRRKPYPFLLPDGLDPVGALTPSGLRTSQAL